MSSIILEDGYNTDYIYSLIIGVFHNKTNIYQLLNNDIDNSDTYYLQEFLKHKILNKLNDNLMIESETINKLRVFLFNAGWLKNTNKYIFDKCDIHSFYIFLICNMLDYKLNLTIMNIEKNFTKKKSLQIIELNDTHFEETNNISKALDLWLYNEQENNILKFEDIPTLIPIYINLQNQKSLNIMESINFEKINDKAQKNILWDFISLICYDEEQEYYYTVIKHNNNLSVYSVKHIPSQFYVSLDDKEIINKITQSIKFVFYAYQ